MKTNEYNWQQQPVAEKWLDGILTEFKGMSDTVAKFETRLAFQTNTRLVDWLDHILLPEIDIWQASLDEAGFVAQDEVSAGGQVYSHPGALFPKIVLGQKTGLAVRVEYLTDFLRANQAVPPIEGSPLSNYRQALLCKESGISFIAVERRESTRFEPIEQIQGNAHQYLEALELWQGIPRWQRNDGEVFGKLFDAADQICSAMGQDLAAHIVMQSERAYWQSRNYAGAIQKMRQDKLGMGWANHDHHTFRSSRQNLSNLILLLKKLGFHEREKFYAGEQAGWGAQVMENKEAGLVLFVDVDLAPEEVDFDFATHELEMCDQLGTIGLWCALHGDSILQAGLHHLAARYSFMALQEGMKEYKVKFLEPFSDFSYLKQAFSKGEMWTVDTGRVSDLLDQGSINQKQAAKFNDKGAVGSHFENIERREGFMGFSQEHVSGIIKRLDPRTAAK